MAGFVKMCLCMFIKVVALVALVAENPAQIKLSR